jgi:hypothetical protein
MIKIAADTVPQSLLSYVAFRVALRDTCELYSEQRGLPAAELVYREPVGYLTEVPILREVASQVQIDLLARTWARHVSRKTFAGDILDEAVLYAACETTARLAESSPQRVVRALSGGPLDLAVPVDHLLASEVRGLYLNLSNEGDFLLASQFLDMAPETADHWKRQLGLAPERLDPLYDALGRWQMSREWTRQLQGLFTEEEIKALSGALKSAYA